MFGLKKTKLRPGLTGIGLHAQGVSVVSVEPGAGGRPRVSACAFRPLNGDAGGRSRVLEQLADEFDLGRRRCTTGLNRDEYSLLLTEAPEVPEEELRAAVRWRIKDLVDFPIQEATVDVFELPGGRAPGRGRSVYVVAAPNAILQRRVDLLTGAGINLDVIDVPEMAQRNLAGLLPQDQGGVVMISFGASQGLITITRDGELYLSRNLKLGLDAFADGGDVLEHYDSVVLEVQRSLDYYDSFFRMAPIGNLVIAPTPSDVSGLIEHINRNLSLSATQMNLHAYLDMEADCAPEQIPYCLGTLGAALRDGGTA